VRGKRAGRANRNEGVSGKKPGTTLKGEKYKKKVHGDVQAVGGQNGRGGRYCQDKEMEKKSLGDHTITGKRKIWKKPKGKKTREKKREREMLLVACRNKGKINRSFKAKRGEDQYPKEVKAVRLARQGGGEKTGQE